MKNNYIALRILRCHDKMELETYVNYTKPSECVDIIRHTPRGFHSWCPGSTGPLDECFQGTSWENRVMFFGLYQPMMVVLYLLYTQPEISFSYSMIA